MKDKLMNILNIVAGSIVVTAPFLALIINLMMFPTFNGIIIPILVFIISLIGSSGTIVYFNREMKREVFIFEDMLFSLTYSTVITLIVSVLVLNFNY